MSLLKKTSRAVLVGLLAGLLKALSRKGAPKQIRKLLVVRIDQRLGNVLLTTPLIERLKRELPQTEVEVLVADSKVGVLPQDTKVLAFPKKAFFKAPGRFWRILLSLRKARYDAVIDASHWHHFSLTSSLITAFTGAPLRITHQRGYAHKFANQLVPPAETEEAETFSKQRLLAPLGLEPDAEAPMRTDLGTASAEKGFASDFFKKEGLVGLPLIGLSPGARKPNHRVAPEVFAQIGERARRLGFRPLVLWGPGEEELAQFLGQRIDAPLAPPTNLEQLAALMRSCSVVVANDTGPMHLAVACQTPTMALFRNSQPGRWGHNFGPHRAFDTDTLTKEVLVLAVEKALVPHAPTSPSLDTQPRS